MSEVKNHDLSELLRDLWWEEGKRSGD